MGDLSELELYSKIKEALGDVTVAPLELGEGVDLREMALEWRAPQRCSQPTSKTCDTIILHGGCPQSEDRGKRRCLAMLAWDNSNNKLSMTGG